jgi:hypothetical protein
VTTHPESVGSVHEDGHGAEPREWPVTATATLARYVNKVVMPIVEHWSRWPRQTGGRGLCVLAYQGRRTGKAVRIVVGFRRTETGATVDVELAERKSWWRNFTGAGSTLVLQVRGHRFPGHGVATRDADGKVRVRIDFTPDTAER